MSYLKLYKKFFAGLEHQLTSQELETFEAHEIKMQNILTVRYASLLALILLIITMITQPTSVILTITLFVGGLYVGADIRYRAIVSRYSESLLDAQERILGEVK